MKYNRKRLKKTICFSLVVVFALSSLNLLHSINIDVKDPIIEDEIPLDFLQTSAGEGLDPWWNEDFRYRRCINLTNPYDENLTNWRTYIEIDTTDLIPEKMQSDLGDIRIVENGVLREYYCTREGNIARIWFKTDIQAFSSEYDTYLYYGNDTVSYDATYYKEYDFGMCWYTFDNDNSPSTVEDSMGHQVVNPSAYNHDGVLNGLGTQVGYYSESHSGKSVKFNDTQTSAYINAPYTIVQGLTTYTITFWARRDITSGTEYLISGSGVSGGHNYMLYDAPTEPSWKLYVCRRTSSLTTDHHVYWGDGSTPMQLYDTLIYSTPSTPLNLNPGGFIIAQEQDSLGGGFDANQAYNGYLDEFRVFNYALSDDEMNWLRLDRSLTYEFLEERIRAAEVTVIVKDGDGSLITDQLARVYLWNESSGAPIANHTVGTDGTVLFEDVAYDNYTITVNYTKTLPDLSVIERQVYNSTEKGEIIEYKGLTYDTVIYTDLWSMTFAVEDWDGDPMNQGFVVINDTDDTVLANLTLDSEGKASFIWLNRSEGYNYSVYYDNIDLVERLTLINSSTIYPIDKSQHFTVSELNRYSPSSPEYYVNEDIYVEGTLSKDSIGDNKVIDIQISLSDMEDTMTSLYVKFVRDGFIGGNVVEETYTGVKTEETISIYGSDYAYDIYGINLEISGDNSSGECPGTIDVILSYTRTHTIIANISKLNIKLIDDKYYNPVAGMTVHIKYNGTSNDVTTKLITGSDGYAYGKTTGLPFWYIRENVYNISIWQTASLHYQLKVNDSDQGFPVGIPIDGYNYTLNNATTLILEVFFSAGDQVTRFFNGSTEDTGVVNYEWGENVTLWINFTYSDNGLSGPWNPDSGNPSTSGVTCTIKTSLGMTVFTTDLTFVSNGNYTLEFNTSVLSAGYNGKSYDLVISGWKHTYISPEADIRTIQVLPLDTGLTMHNYDTVAPDELSKLPVSGYYYTSTNYGYTLNVSMRYYDLISGTILTPDTYSYSWDEGSGVLIPDTVHAGYWVLEFDTTTASETKEYTFEITMGLENHTSQEDIICKITIDDKKTEINGSVKYVYEMVQDVWINDEKIFYFEYNDSLDTQRLGLLDKGEVEWYKIETDGNETRRPDLQLTQTSETLHMLDLNTEDLAVGLYKVYITIEKTNYESKLIIITMNIKKRPIEPGIDSLYVSGDQGPSIQIYLSLTDPSNNSIALTGVIINLIISGQNYTFTESSTPGEYYLDFPTGGYNTFLMPQTIVGTIQMSKSNYETESIPITIVIEMPKLLGIPTFYLLMIVLAIAAVAGSLGVYRYLQIRNIPKFVKKNKAMRKAINSKSKIGDNMLYPTKSEATVKLLGNKWDDIGLSLGDILGIQDKKRKNIPEMKDKIKEKKGGDV